MPNNSNMEHYTLTERVIGKMASLETELQQGFRRLDEKMDRFQSDLHSAQIDNNDKINRLDKETAERISIVEGRLQAGEKRLTDIETWQKVLLAKISVVLAVAAAIGSIVGPGIADILGIG